MEIILVRHGESVYNRDGIIQGHVDIPLSDFGKEQSRMIAGKLINYISGKKLLAVYSSDLKRSRQTARPFIGMLREKGIDVEIKCREELREVLLGVWEGKTKEELLSEKDESGISQFQAWLDNPVDVIPEGAESMPDFFERAKKALFEIIEENRCRDGVIVVFTHGGMMSMILNYADGRTPDNFYMYSFENASGHILSYNGDRLRFIGEL